MFPLWVSILYFYSLYFGQLWVSMLIIICCKRKLPSYLHRLDSPTTVSCFVSPLSHFRLYIMSGYFYGSFFQLKIHTVTNFPTPFPPLCPPASFHVAFPCLQDTQHIHHTTSIIVCFFHVSFSLPFAIPASQTSCLLTNSQCHRIRNCGLATCII